MSGVVWLGWGFVAVVLWFLGGFGEDGVMGLSRVYGWFRWFPLLALVVGVWIAFQGPMEQTLGVGIRAVYLHVPLIWTGINGLLLASLVGVVLAATGLRRARAWCEAGSWVSLALFGAGVGMSSFAAKLNWGVWVLWSEPRTRMALVVLGLGVSLAVLASRVKQVRLVGVMHAIFGAVVAWSIAVTPLRVHPQDPIGESDSGAIQMTFYALFALATVSSMSLTWVVQKRRSRALREG